MIDVNFFYRVSKLKDFRNTTKVNFYSIPILEELKGIDLVVHESLALSPGSVGNVDHAWYWHNQQIDNLVVTHGSRRVELFKTCQPGPEFFEVTPAAIIRLIPDKHGQAERQEILCSGPGILSWSIQVYHRIISGPAGSASLNFAVRLPGFDMKTNFNIYDLNLQSGVSQLIRRGEADQH